MTLGTSYQSSDSTGLPPAIFLMGPTTSGKSNIAMEIAKYFPVEIISVDSAQVYQHMDIGTAKPDAASLKKVPHHLINLIKPDERYSAAQFREDALTIMHQITQRRRIPLLAGGTMLYFHTLQAGLSILPPANRDLRVTIENNAKDYGWPAMHRKLNELDPVSAARIKPTDSQRIQRALEVCYLTEKPMSEILQRPSKINLPYRIINITLIPSDRSILHQRIAQRFEVMMEKGFITEVQSIRKQFQIDSAFPSMRCVGYRQALLYLDNQISFTEMHAMSLAATRQLAKRQLTWLRGMQNEEFVRFDCLAKNLTEQVISFLQEAELKAT